MTQHQTPYLKPEPTPGMLRGFDLTGRRAIVFGSETPEGREIVAAFGEAGASVTGVASVTGADAAAEINAMVQSAGGIDIAVVVPDAYHAAPVAETSDEDVSRLVGDTLGATYRAFRAAAIALKDHDDGRLIAIISAVGLRGLPGLSAYGAAHAGIAGLVRGLSQELGSDGVTVNAIATAWTHDTPGRGPDAVERNQLLRYIPMRRFGNADEAALLAVYLASNASGYVSGQIIAVDGGVLKHL